MDIEAPVRIDKRYRFGTHRCLDPAETLHRVQPFMSAMGITRIADVTGLDRVGLPVVMVCRPNARSVAVSQGKGLTPDAARASGLMEAIETFHAEQALLPVLHASLHELRSRHLVVDTDGLPHARNGLFHPERALLWVAGINLVDEAPLWVPVELVHANYTLPLPPGSGCFLASTNGLASGNHRLEAVCHAICELIERDATTLWRRLDEAHRNACRLEPASVDDPLCREALQRFAAAGVEVAVWDSTSDIGIPAFVCWVLNREGDPRPANGKGCHPSRSIALLRALTEAAQTRLTYIAGSRDDLQAAEYDSGRLRQDAQYYRRLFEQPPARHFEQVPDWPADSFDDDLRRLLIQLTRVGIEQVVMVDLGDRERFDIPVVRVVIPGIEGPDEHPDYTPGQRARRMTTGR